MCVLMFVCVFLGGFGGTEALDKEGEGESAAKQRREQGYGGEKDMDRSIGA